VHRRGRWRSCDWGGSHRHARTAVDEAATVHELFVASRHSVTNDVDDVEASADGVDPVSEMPRIVCRRNVCSCVGRTRWRTTIRRSGSGPHPRGIARSATSTLRAILAHARAGRLDPQWRDALHAPPTTVPTHEMYSDADQLAVEELKDYPEVPWEPHRGRSWRESLDA
jgi:hypothetical protein